jgi:hypothetical protein
MDKAPLGHFATWATIASVVAPLGTIHGRSPGLKTAPNSFQHFLLWMQSSFFQTMVTSPLL